MKKFVGRDKNGEIVFYEEIKDVKELGDVKELKNKPFINRTDFLNYWFLRNWDLNLELDYQVIRLIRFLCCFPFILIKRVYLILTKRDWGNNYINFSDFFKKVIIPFIFIFVIFCLIFGNFFLKIHNEVSLKAQIKKERLIEIREKSKNNIFSQETKKRRGNGEVYLGPKIGWYKIEGLPNNYKTETKNDYSSNPPQWKN